MRPVAKVTGVGGAFWLAVAAERLWYPVRCGAVPVRYPVQQRIKRDWFPKCHPGTKKCTRSQVHP